MELGKKAVEGDAYSIGKFGATTASIFFIKGTRGKRLSAKKSATQIRNQSGAAHGAGTEVKGQWIRGSQGQAGVFPKSVADALKGQTFSSFDEFRGAFWRAVGNDSKLSSTFTNQNVTRMQNGHAPRVTRAQQHNGSNSYHLHHKKAINQGGGVYDMDNLIIVTPKYHYQTFHPKK